MNNKHQFSPSRLKLARKRRGMTLVRLEQLSGISTRTLSGYENVRSDSREHMTDKILETLAHALQVPAMFLTAEDIEEIPLEAVSFRAPSKLTAGQRDMALAAARIAIMINEWVEERFRLPEPDIPTLTGRDPELAAEQVRNLWQLGVAPIPNLVHLLEAHGTRVFSLAEECLEVDAFSFYWKGTPYVIINTRKSGERGRFDAAHELGHLVLHPEHEVPHGKLAEQQAQRFASAFLMPPTAVRAKRLNNATVDRVLAAKKTWKVSAMALTYRLHELDLVTEWGYRTLATNLSRMGYRRQEPDGIDRESSQLLAKVFGALRAEGVTVAHMARALHLSPEEINQHVFGLVPTPVAAVRGGGHTTPPRPPALQLVK
ncbi:MULTISPECIES: helix-turn-helix domain-containing protein [Streptosporangium]|uniref:Zn-dependent peptidase ImmA (M78 family) n=1 Tax=Streptosporangium brasiliense TaxID=47480 RepID=A0ABT9R565_9ACTN|nr:XRE family transcriptional regulator [Streptosporangium brasiliense]MDP9864036.1 Zn-dependent peptidase ImmA (M78 family) [Streptosporangium brasiliense]